jgi:hypothetical protein
MPTLKDMLPVATRDALLSNKDYPLLRAIYDMGPAALWKGLSDDMKAFLPAKHCWMVKYIFIGFGRYDNAGTRYFTGTCNEFRDWANQLKADTKTPWMHAYILPKGLKPWQENNYEWLEGFDFSL